MKKYIPLLLILIALLFCVSAAASQPEAGGYLFMVKEDAVVLLSEDSPVDCIHAPTGLYRADTLADIQQSVGLRNVAYIEEDCIVTLYDDAASAPETDRWDLSQIRHQYPYYMGLQGEGIRIGLVDSGINAAHENLKNANLIPGKNFITNAQDPTDNTGEYDPANTGDDYGHGTFIAGLLVGTDAESQPWTGLCPGAELVALKAFSTKNSSLSYVLPAIYAAVDAYQCDILNLSFGTNFNKESLRLAIEYAVARGVVCVAAVGNNGSSTLSYPAAYNGVIGAAAVDRTGGHVSLSQVNNSVYLSAPGSALTSLHHTGGLGSGTGTSYACPYVTAAAAIALQADPALTAADVQTLLAETADDLGEEGYDTTFGHGLLNLQNLVTELCFSQTEIEDAFVVEGNFFGNRPANLLFAAYDKSGRLLTCAGVPDSAAATQYSFPAGTTQVKLLGMALTDGSPVWEPLRWIAQTEEESGTGGSTEGESVTEDITEIEPDTGDDME